MQLRYIIIPILAIGFINAVVRYIIQIRKTKKYSPTNLSMINFLFMFVPLMLGMMYFIIFPLFLLITIYW